MGILDVTLPKGLRLNTFVPFLQGYAFIVMQVSPNVKVTITEREDYNLGIVNAHDITIGEGGVLCGMYFSTTQSTRLLPNALLVYRNRLVQSKTSELLNDPGNNLQLKYRPTSSKGVPMLRIFTIGTDLVLVGSDLPDSMKPRLESQD